MAQKVQIQLLDDMDGSEAVGTVSFGLDGTEYEIDLNWPHTAELRAAIGKYAEHARKVTGRSVPRQRRGARNAEARSNTQAIREWAAAQSDIEIKERGRIPEWVVARYHAAMSGAKVQATEPVKAPEPKAEEPKKPAEKPTRAPRKPRAKKVTEKATEKATEPVTEAPEAAFSG